MSNLVDEAENLPEHAWKRLERPAKYSVKTTPRKRPVNEKERVVVRREFKNIRLNGEDVAEFEYTPTACKKAYRIVVIRKNLTVQRGEQALFDDVRYFFYITNDRDMSASEVVFNIAAGDGESVCQASDGVARPRRAGRRVATDSTPATGTRSAGPSARSDRARA